MKKVIYKKGAGIVVLHKDLKAGDLFVYAEHGDTPSIFMKVEEDGELHTVDLETGHIFNDQTYSCLESKVVKLDTLIFTCASKS